MCNGTGCSAGPIKCVPNVFESCDYILWSYAQQESTSAESNVVLTGVGQYKIIMGKVDIFGPIKAIGA